VVPHAMDKMFLMSVHCIILS